MNNIEDVRKNFPVTKNLIYLDNAAVAPVHNLTKKYMDEYMEHFLNFGLKDYAKWADFTEATREKLAQFINAKPNEIAFVKNTSAGLSIIANGIDFKHGENVIIPDIEFPSNVYPWLNLERKGVKTKFWKSDEKGFLDCKKLEELIDCNTRLVSISWIEFVNGFKNDLKAISQIIKNKSNEFGKKIYFCVDAIQDLGALKFDINDYDIDFVVADGHKWLLTLEGAGFMYCSEKVLDGVHPVSVGWKTVKDALNFTKIDFDIRQGADKFEEGSMNIAGITSMEASMDLFSQYGMDFVEERVLELSDYAISLFEEKGFNIASCKDTKHRSGIVSFTTPDIEKDFLKLMSSNVQLSKRGPNLRISPHFYNTKEEINRLVELLS